MLLVLWTVPTYALVANINISSTYFSEVVKKRLVGAEVLFALIAWKLQRNGRYGQTKRFGQTARIILDQLFKVLFKEYLTSTYFNFRENAF